MDLTTKDTLTVKEFAKTFDIKILHEEFYFNKGYKSQKESPRINRGHFLFYLMKFTNLFQ